MVLELEATQAQVQRILQSRAFRASEVHRNLLSYLAEKSLSGASDSLKEYTLGLDVFSKPASYDPRQESTVRMHVGRLRQKLAEYYRTEGVDDSIIVDLPKGGFKVTFEPRQTAEPPVLPEEPVVVERTFRREIVLAVALLVALGSAGYFGVRLWRIERSPATQAAAWTPELQQIWGPMLATNRPLILCLSTPSSSFSSVGAASGAFRLGQFLSRQNVLLTPSDQLSAPEIAMGNVVFLGTMSGNRQVQALPVERQIVLEPQGVRNLHPRPGEPEYLADRPPADLQDMEESYALISHVPGLYGDGEILYISGNHVSSVMAGVQALTDPSLARTLVAKMAAPAGLPHYFQVVLKARSMDDMPIDISYVLHRELSVAKSGPGK